MLPINGRIIYDGLLFSYRISFGPGIRRSLNENFKVAKATFGIITSLPEEQSPPVVRKKARSKKPAASAGTADVKAVLEATRNRASSNTPPSWSRSTRRSWRMRCRLPWATAQSSGKPSETTERTAMTIHRLLEFDPATGEFKKNQQNPRRSDAQLATPEGLKARE